MREPVPQVLFDAELGRSLGDVDINYEALVAYMQELGFDDDRISKTAIYIKADNTLYIDDNGNKNTINGLYDRCSGSIGLYPYWAIYLFNENASTMSSLEEIEAFRHRVDTWMSENFSTFLVHELVHAILNPPNESNSYKDSPHDTTYRTLAQVAMSQTGYDDSYEEEVCREAGQKGPKNLLRLQIRANLID